MKRFQLALVLGWSIVSCLLAVFYAATRLLSGKGPQPMMPAYLGYLWVGGLGGAVGNVLISQHRRIQGAPCSH